MAYYMVWPMGRSRYQSFLELELVTAPSLFADLLFFSERFEGGREIKTARTERPGTCTFPARLELRDNACQRTILFTNMNILSLGQARTSHRFPILNADSLEYSYSCLFLQV